MKSVRKASGFPARSRHFSSQRRLEGCAYQTALRRLVRVQAHGKVKPFRTAGRRSPLVSSGQINSNFNKPSLVALPLEPALSGSKGRHVPG